MLKVKAIEKLQKIGKYEGTQELYEGITFEKDKYST